MASIYTSSSSDMYPRRAPGVMQSALKRADQKRGHINVSKKVDVSIGPHRKAQINVANSPGGSTYQTYGTDLSGFTGQYGALDAPQNALAFTLVGGRTPSSRRNVYQEQLGSVFMSLTGITFTKGISQDVFEEAFLFTGVCSREYRAGEPGSTVPVSLTGANTVTLGGKDVWAGDRLMWRLPSIDPNQRDADQAFEKNVRRDGLHPNALFPLLERVDPSDAELAPRKWMATWLSDIKNPAKADATSILKAPHKQSVLFETANKTLSSKDLFIAGQVSFAQWVALCTFHAMKDRNLNNNTVEQFATALGFGPEGTAVNTELLQTLYTAAFGGDSSTLLASVGTSRDAVVKAKQNAPYAQFSSAYMAHNALRRKIILTTMEHAPAWGKVDAYN